MSDVVQLLSAPKNFAVVHLPGWSFPGVVVQGDTLNGMVSQLELIGRLAQQKNYSELGDEILTLREQLVSAREWYEHVCAEHSIPLPYSPR